MLFYDSFASILRENFIAIFILLSPNESDEPRVSKVIAVVVTIVRA